jgi:hypothetical protein
MLDRKSEADALSAIRSSILPWYGRLIWSVASLLKKDPFPEESLLLDLIATSASGDDIEDAFFQYGKTLSKPRRLIPRYLGVSPKPSRVFGYYRKLKARGSAPSRSHAA